MQDELLYFLSLESKFQSQLIGRLKAQLPSSDIFPLERQGYINKWSRNPKVMES